MIAISKQVGQKGYSLVELSVVLVIIGLIIGAVSMGQNIQRSATYQKIASQFILGWREAYFEHRIRTGLVPGDNPANPTQKVDGAEDNPGEICSDDLFKIMDQAGIRMPAGRGEGLEDQIAYLDTNGNPQRLEICFKNVEWSIAGPDDTYVERDRNVMVIKQLTPDFARFLDSQIDGNNDARFGFFREDEVADSTSTKSVLWSIDNRMAYGQTSISNKDESQIAVVSAYLLLESL